MKIVIAGGGIAGLSCAVAIKKLTNHSVKVLCGKKDQRFKSALNSSSFISYTGLWSPSLRVLRKLGLFSSLQESFEPVRKSGYRAVDGCWLANPHKGLNSNLLSSDPSLAFIKEKALLDKLSEHLEPSDFIQNSEFTAVSSKNNNHYIQTTDNQEIPFDLFIAADGWGSNIKEYFNPPQSKNSSFSEKLKQDYRGYNVYRGHVSNPTKTLISPLLPLDKSNFVSFQTWGEKTRFAVVPTVDGFAWFAAITHDSNLKTPSILSLKDLKTHFKHWHDPISLLLDQTDGGEEGIRVDFAVASTIPYWGFGEVKNQFFEKISTGKGESPYVVYIGDAAHTLDPILAQGAGVAVESSFYLAERLSTIDTLDKKGIMKLSEELLSFEQDIQKRLRVLHVLSNLSQLVGHLPFKTLCIGRDVLLKMIPGFLKGRIFDVFIKSSVLQFYKNKH